MPRCNLQRVLVLCEDEKVCVTFHSASISEFKVSLSMAGLHFDFL